MLLLFAFSIIFLGWLMAVGIIVAFIITVIVYSVRKAINWNHDSSQ